MSSFPAPLYGLVLAGGESLRMGYDKGLIHYHDTDQRDWAARLLVPFCQRVFVSLHEIKGTSVFPVLEDDASLGRIGPIAALVTAMTHYPDVAWLVTGCDQPLLEATDFQSLIANRSEQAYAVCFISPDSKMAQPFPALYEPAFGSIVAESVSAKRYSLRASLEKSPIVRLQPEKPDRLQSIDDPEESEKLIQRLRKNLR